MGMLIPSIGDRCAALKDTSMGTVPGTTAGAGALAPAPEVLTIDKRGLRGIWLPAEKKEYAALVQMERECMRAVLKPRYKWLHQARMALYFQHQETVRNIIKNGGLLHIGAAV